MIDFPRDKEAARIMLEDAHKGLRHEIEVAYKEIGINKFDEKHIKIIKAAKPDRYVEFHFISDQLFLVGIIQMAKGQVHIQVKRGHEETGESNIDIVPADFLVGGEKPKDEELHALKKMWEKFKITL